MATNNSLAQVGSTSIQLGTLGQSLGAQAGGRQLNNLRSGTNNYFDPLDQNSSGQTKQLYALRNKSFYTITGTNQGNFQTGIGGATAMVWVKGAAYGGSGQVAMSIQAAQGSTVYLRNDQAIRGGGGAGGAGSNPQANTGGGAGGTGATALQVAGASVIQIYNYGSIQGGGGGGGGGGTFYVHQETQIPNQTTRASFTYSTYVGPQIQPAFTYSTYVPNQTQRPGFTYLSGFTFVTQNPGFTYANYAAFYGCAFNGTTQFGYFVDPFTDVQHHDTQQGDFDNHFTSTGFHPGYFVDTVFTLQQYCAYYYITGFYVTGFAYVGPQGYINSNYTYVGPQIQPAFTYQTYVPNQTQRPSFTYQTYVGPQIQPAFSQQGSFGFSGAGGGGGAAQGGAGGGGGPGGPGMAQNPGPGGQAGSTTAGGGGGGGLPQGNAGAGGGSGQAGTAGQGGSIYQAGPTQGAWNTQYSGNNHYNAGGGGGAGASVQGTGIQWTVAGTHN